MAAFYKLNDKYILRGWDKTIEGCTAALGMKK